MGTDFKMSTRSAVERYSTALVDLSRSIHAEPEQAFAEHRSAAKVADLLAAEGFEVERGVADLETAFTASFGSRRARWRAAWWRGFRMRVGASSSSVCCWRSPSRRGRVLCTFRSPAAVLPLGPGLTALGPTLPVPTPPAPAGGVGRPPGGTRPSYG